MNTAPQITLASASPRRSELMSLVGIPFTVCSADICETPLPGEKPDDHVSRLSREKAKAVAVYAEGRFFVGADTIVVIDGQILGKPLDEADAFRMLSALSGRSHTVITGFSVFDRDNGECVTETVVTEVTFKILDDYEINAYIATGCPMDKAGGYAMQGGAAHFVRAIHGSYTNVIGLPMTELYEVLKGMDAL